ncbi:MAG: hypothetical protein ACR2QK_01575 [Acidimicrobiales bacterium]
MNEVGEGGDDPALAAADEAADLDAAAAARYLPVSGRYRSCPEPWELTLRVDLDGYRPTRRVSGDYFRKSGSTFQYFGSFIVDAVQISVSPTMIRVVGMARTTWSTAYNKLWLWIPRHVVGQTRATAHVLWTTAVNRRGATYRCLFQSPYFRTVLLEQDTEVDVADVFQSYNTGALPSGGPARTLTIGRAYREAGVEVADSPFGNKVPVPDGKTWDNAELHAAMENHFRYWKDSQQWRVWYFHAHRHVYGPGLYGIMFDQKGPHRQGCAGFYQGVGGTTAVKRRDQLYVGVHELGHCFNLFHSFHKTYMKPPLPNRPDALSWMNYPSRYQADSTGGAAAFWNAFPFQFDLLERIHLRHAFYENIVFGGNPFGTGAALDVGAEYSNVSVDQSGLRLELSAEKSTFRWGEPPIVEIALRLRDLNGKDVVSERQLHPNFGHVQIAVQRPGGEVVPFTPPLHHCAELETVRLDEDNSWSKTSAYVGYDANAGQVFDAPGRYRLRAAYFALDGSLVLSNVFDLRVSPPFSAEDQVVGDLLLGDDQGMLLYLLGSDSESLQSGNDALAEVLDSHGDHPLALYARLAVGNNLGRTFGMLDADGTYNERSAEPGESAEMLRQVIDDSQEEGVGLDDLSVLGAMERLAAVQNVAGDQDGAAETRQQIADFATAKELSAQTLTGLAEEE